MNLDRIFISHSSHNARALYSSLFLLYPAWPLPLLYIRHPTGTFRYSIPLKTIFRQVFPLNHVPLAYKFWFELVSWSKSILRLAKCEWKSPRASKSDYQERFLLGHNNSSAHRPQPRLSHAFHWTLVCHWAVCRSLCSWPPNRMVKSPDKRRSLHVITAVCRARDLMLISAPFIDQSSSFGDLAVLFGEPIPAGRAEAIVYFPTTTGSPIFLLSQ